MLYPNGADFVIGAFAAARIGAVAVPFSTFATTRELGEQLVGSDIRILLATAVYRAHDYRARLTELLPGAFEGVAPHAADRLLCPQAPQLRHIAMNHGTGTGHRLRDIGVLDRLADTVGEELLAAMERNVGAADPLAIIYTSGSTSAPKGAVHTHGALL